MVAAISWDPSQLWDLCSLLSFSINFTALLILITLKFQDRLWSQTEQVGNRRSGHLGIYVFEGDIFSLDLYSLDFFFLVAMR
jgi:hypothetical protein